MRFIVFANGAGFLLIFEPDQITRLYSFLSSRPWSKGGFARIDALREAKLLALHSAVQQHETEQLTIDAAKKQLENESLPISRIPSEIILMIFEVAVDSGSTSPEDLIGVCHRWRELAKGENGSRLWSCPQLSYIHTEKMGCVRHLSTYLELSRQSPLKISLTMQDCDSEDTPQGADFLLPILTPHMKRIEAMSISADYSGEAFGLLPLSSSLSSLQNLALLYPHGLMGMGDKNLPILNHPLPLLKRLELRGDWEALDEQQVERMLVNASQFCSLTYLKFRACLVGDIAGLQSLCVVLERFSELVSLDIGVEDAIAAENWEADVIRLPQLRQLTIEGGSGLRILKNVFAPGVDELTLKLPKSPSYGRDTFRSWFSKTTPKFPALRVAVLPLSDALSLIEDGLGAMECLESLELQYLTDRSSSQLVSAIHDLDLLLSRRPQTHDAPRFCHLHLTPRHWSSRNDLGNLAADLVDVLQSLAETQSVIYERHRTPFRISVDTSLANSCKKLKALVARDPFIAIGPTLERQDNWMPLSWLVLSHLFK